MKKVLFALPALAFTLFLTFCQKSNVQEEVIPVNTNTAVSGRGVCDIEIFADNLNQLRICGLPTIVGGALNPCNLCPSGNGAAGINVINGYAFFDDLVTPITFSITNAGTSTTYVRVAAPGTLGSGWVALAASGGCAEFTVNDNCSVN